MKKRFVTIACLLLAGTAHADGFTDYAEETTPVGGDFLIMEQADSSATNYLTFTNLVANYLDAIYAPVLGADDNYVTDAQVTLLEATSGANTGDQDLSGYQPLDDYLTDIAAITAAEGDILYFDGTDWVKLLAGTAGQFLETQGASEIPRWGDPTGSGDITAVGDVPSGAAFTADGAGNVLYFEGTTANDFEIAVTGANPVADVVVTVPAATDTLVGKATTDVLTNKDLSSGTNTFPTFNQDTTGTAATATTAATAAAGDSATSFFPSGTIEAARLPDLSGTYVPTATGATHMTDLSDDTTPSLAGNLAVGVYEIQSTGDIVLQLGDAVGSNVFEVEDSAGTAVFSVNSDGGMSTISSTNPSIQLDQASGSADDFWIGAYDTGTDRLEIRGAAAAGTSVYTYFDANGLYSDGNHNLSTGHTYQINGTQIALTNLSDGLSHASGHIQSGTDEIDGDLIDIDYAQSNYTPATTGVATDVNHLAAHLEGIDDALGASGTGTLAGMTDTNVSTPAAGHLLIYDGTDTWDNKVVSGDVAITSAGVTTIQSNAVENSMMADSAIDTAELAADAVEGAKIADDQIDSEHYVAASIDNEHLADDAVGTDELANDLNIITTGTVQGKVKVTNKSTDATLVAAEMDGMVFVTATGTMTLPAVSIGTTVCVYSTTAAAVYVDPNASDRIVLSGTALDDGDKLTSESGAGDFVCLIGDSAAGWTTLGMSGAWTDGS